MIRRHPGRSSPPPSFCWGLALAAAVIWTGLGMARAVAGEPVMVAPGASLDAGTLGEMIKQDLPLPGEGVWSVRILEPFLPLTNPTAASVSVTMAEDGRAAIDPDAPVARIAGRLQVTDAAGHTAPLGFVAELRAMVTIPVPRRPVLAGLAPEASMFEEAYWPRERLDDGIVRSVDEMVGTETARRLPAGRPVLRAALQAPRAVRRGEPVLLTFTKGGLRLTMAGHALEDAALGELVRADNAMSGRQVRGRVRAPGQIMLGELE